MAKRASKPGSAWRNRIVGHGEESPDQILAHPKNWRIHPQSQQEALKDVISEIGWIQEVIINVRSSEQWAPGERNVHTLLDGHLRVILAMRHGIPSVPVKYVDLSDEEERLALAVYDPITNMAGADKEALSSLLHEVSTGSTALQALLAGLAEQHQLVPPAPPDDLLLGDMPAPEHTGRLCVCPKCGFEFEA